MIFSSGLGLSEEEVAASLNPQTIAANEGNSKLAQAVADELSSRGYPAWVEESCGNLTWTGMVPPCSYIIHAQGLETYASYSGDMYEQRNARDEALRIIGDATGYYPQGEYPSTVQVSVPTQVPTLTKSVAATTAAPAKVSISNVTRPGSSYFQPGDRYRVEVTGQPNSPVSVTVIFPNGDVSSSSYGSTDSSGYFAMYGDMTDAHIGHWVETWRVGDKDASPVLSFDVLKPQAAASTATPSSAATGQPVQQTVLQQAAGAIEGAGWADWLKQNPLIALGGAALLVILLMGGRK
jgi:hypothetical protein